MSEPCGVIPGSLQCEECDDWVIITIAPYQRADGAWTARSIEKCRRISSSALKTEESYK